MDGSGSCQNVPAQGGLPDLGFGPTRGHVYVAGGRGALVFDESTLTEVTFLGIQGPEGGGTVGSQVLTESASQRVFIRSYRDLTSGESSALLVVDDLAPVIDQHPAAQTVRPGTVARLDVLARGTGTLHYAWYRGTRGDVSTPVGTDSDRLVTEALDASTSFWVRVSDDLGSGDSFAAAVTVDADFGVWREMETVTSRALLDVHFTDENQGWAVGARGTILHTTNGGSSWTPQTSGTLSGLEAVHFTGPARGWAVGDSGTILSTEDGGETWNPQSSGTTIYDLKDVYFVDDAHGWVVGAYGATVLTTDDGGDDWTLRGDEVLSWLYGVVFADELSGWAVGYGGTLVSTTDGGLTWTERESASVRQFNGIDFFASRVWTVGEGEILTSTNAGVDWSRQDDGTIVETLHAVDFTSAERGFAVGTTGTIIKTQDGGASWFYESADTTVDLYGLFDANQRLGSRGLRNDPATLSQCSALRAQRHLDGHRHRRGQLHTIRDLLWNGL